MEIVVNGKNLSCSDGMTIQDLLLKLELVPNAILVEHNTEFVQRSTYPTTVLSEGDSLELIEFVGGG